ncbi:hypothetical protein MMA231_02402 [Asticcacaulis sp. MM231]
MKEYEPENEQNILGIKILNFFYSECKRKVFNFGISNYRRNVSLEDVWLAQPPHQPEAQ